MLWRPSRGVVYIYMYVCIYMYIWEEFLSVITEFDHPETTLCS